MTIYKTSQIILVSLFSIQLLACSKGVERTLLSQDDNAQNSTAGENTDEDDKTTTNKKSTVLEDASLTYVQPEAADLKKRVDILFVIDTSTSLNNERKEIADALDQMIDSIPLTIDIQIGVMLGHQNPARSGKLYQRGSEPKILRSADLSTAEIQEEFQYKFHTEPGLSNMPSEGHSDGGEAGNYSINEAFTTNYDNLVKDGFFRENSGLVIIPVSDENDLCSRDIDISPATFVPDHGEKKFYPKYCLDADGDIVVNHVSVLENIKAMIDDTPLLIAPIIYTGETPVPTHNEDEIGYGYREMAELASGTTVNIGDPTGIPEGLKSIAEKAVQKLEFKRVFALDKEDIDPSTITVKVDGVELDSTEFSYKEELNEVHLDDETPLTPEAVIEITYSYEV